MNILIITWNFPPRQGGIESLIGHLYRGLKETNSVQLITAHANGIGRTDERIHHAPFRGLIAFALYSLWRGTWLLFRDRKIEVIFGGSCLVAPLIVILARLFRRRAVVQVHGLDLIYRSVLYQALCVRWGKFCDRIIANSKYTASVAEAKGFPQRRICVIPPGVDPERFSWANSNGGGENKTILFVGRLARRKGVREFIECCLNNIVREVPTLRFIIVGANPSDSLAHHEDVATEIKRAIAKCGLENHVRLMTAVDNAKLVRLYRECDLLVLPALEKADDAEGFGIVLLEAAAAGKPTVATRVGGIPDAVEDGKSGILVEAGDYKSLSQGIIEILQNSDLGLAMGDFGQRRVRDQFAWPKIVPRYVEAFGASTKN
jgi:phosphatidylinositol alpha-1,6-mannosyltransferase